MAPIRILHVVNCLATGGTEMVVRHLAAGLDANDFEQVICSVCTPAAGLSCAVPVVTLSKPRDRGKLLVASFLRLIRDHHFDVVHTRGWGPIEAIPAAWMAGAAIVHSEHGRDLDGVAGVKLRQRLMRRWCYRMADELFAVSEELRTYFLSQVGGAARRMAVRHNGVDVSEFRPDLAARAAFRARLGLAPTTFVVGTVSRLDPIKDHAMLIDAFETFLSQGRDARLLIVGDGSMRERLEQMVAARTDLARHATFVGESREVLGWLNCFDVFVLTSLSEGMSNTLLEAMSAGVPPIVTAVGGNPEVVIDGDSGVLFSPGDKPALVAALQLLSANVDLRARLGAKARLRVTREFSYETMLRNYADLYQRVAKRCRRQHEKAFTTKQ